MACGEGLQAEEGKGQGGEEEGTNLLVGALHQKRSAVERERRLSTTPSPELHTQFIYVYTKARTNNYY